MITMLVLTEEPLTPHDVGRLATLHAPEPVRAHVVIPAGTDQSTLDQIVDDLARTDLQELADDVDRKHPSDADNIRQAQQALDASIEALVAAGLEADGTLAPKSPVDCAARLADEHDVDEIIVVTEPHLVSDVLRRDWATKLRHRVKRPVLHFIAGTDQVVS
ncbi:MAG TPA: indole-3-glycerol phosphate synthase [Actinomycetes bacterium]|nr:indole-3-glycerol phosphate synthase [Actinomycetes bacterium]